MRLVWSVVVVAGCSFNSPDVPPDGSPQPGGDGPVQPMPDSPPDAVDPFVPLHVPAAGQAAGTGDLELTGDIDTGALTIGGSTTLPAGVVFDAWPQPGGVDLAVLHVRGLHVPTGTVVRVRGSRALVVVASAAIDIDGGLDGSARRDQPGPGGAGPGAGDGAGRTGMHAGTYRDSGGGGGGFAGAGGGGGPAGAGGCSLSGAGGGATYGDPTLTMLVAGSGGGAVPNTGGCGTRTPGAGGGAIQLSSATRVRVTGGINVGGGGGGGGRAQAVGSSQCNITAGSGGGSGGAIVLQAPVVDGAGTLAANGGGGGSAGGDPDGSDTPPEADGEDGQDGLLAATPAGGGRNVGVWSAAGGPGAIAGDGGAGLGNPDCNANGGGGGGAAGRIVVALPAGASAGLTGTVSPARVSTTY